MEAVFPAVQFEDETRLQSGAVRTVKQDELRAGQQIQLDGRARDGAVGTSSWSAGLGATSWALEGGFVVEAGPRVQTTAALQEGK